MPWLPARFYACGSHQYLRVFTSPLERRLEWSAKDRGTAEHSSSSGLQDICGQCLEQESKSGGHLIWRIVQLPGERLVEGRNIARRANGGRAVEVQKPAVGHLVTDQRRFSGSRVNGQPNGHQTQNAQDSAWHQRLEHQVVQWNRADAWPRVMQEHSYRNIRLS